MHFSNLTCNGFDLTKIAYWLYEIHISNHLNHTYCRYYYNTINRDAHLTECAFLFQWYLTLYYHFQKLGSKHARLRTVVGWKRQVWPNCSVSYTATGLEEAEKSEIKKTKQLCSHQAVKKGTQKWRSRWKKDGTGSPNKLHLCPEAGRRAVSTEAERGLWRVFSLKIWRAIAAYDSYFVADCKELKEKTLTGTSAGPTTSRKNKQAAEWAHLPAAGRGCGKRATTERAA